MLGGTKVPLVMSILKGKIQRTSFSTHTSTTTKETTVFVFQGAWHATKIPESRQNKRNVSTMQKHDSPAVKATSVDFVLVNTVKY